MVSSELPPHAQKTSEHEQVPTHTAAFMQAVVQEAWTEFEDGKGGGRLVAACALARDLVSLARRIGTLNRNPTLSRVQFDAPLCGADLLCHDKLLPAAWKMLL